MRANELTWQDVKRIVNIVYNITDIIDPIRLQGCPDNDGNCITDEEYYTAVLNRFKEDSK